LQKVDLRMICPHDQLTMIISRILVLDSVYTEYFSGLPVAQCGLS